MTQDLHLFLAVGDAPPERAGRLVTHEDHRRIFVRQQPQGVYAFQTEKGTYLTAVGGGGKGEAANKLPLHSDSGKVGG
ncbi:MAG: hypothetical protein ABJB61_09050 [bacterium]